ncbi:hypothetical protein GCM10007860_13420 [Chitiniphilus shinanonensis]|uniref:Lipoprotein n=1 Tax=Chitiniphilus shinanonensis TaxID=553088 RepID=A0ABQ6BUI8_9NEIS|nr:hypothetical protein [Chitiniphilus shinanonensis]GLS04196.1 hypothetical protein GCM10007860_13420 [Chitiniphilus shinanonensis]
MRPILALVAVLFAAQALACELEVSKPAKDLSVSVDNMRHGIKNELTLFLTLKNEGKQPVKLAQGFDVLDEQGRRVAPAKVEGAVAELAPGASVQVVSYYLPSPDYTATLLDLK